MNKRIAANVTFAALIAGSTLSSATLAGEPAEPTSAEPQSTVAQLERETSDAWREGKLDTIYLFNRHLNNFTIDPEVRGNTVVLTGKVESEVDKELAEQLALGMDGIDEVTNRLTVVPSKEAREAASKGDRNFSDKVEDATLTAEVKTKLLANGETGGLAIDVDTQARMVTLSGSVKSAEEKALAGEIAKNVDGVNKVNNKLEVKS